MLTELSLKNFKCIAEATLPLSKVNVIIGLNGSGKSSVIQSLALVKQSMSYGSLRLSGPLLDLGEFGDVVRHTAGHLELGLAGHAEPREPVIYEDLELRAVEFRSKITSADGNLSSGEIAYQLETGPRIVGRWSSTETRVEPPEIQMKGFRFTLGVNRNVIPTATVQRVSEQPSGIGRDVGGRLASGLNTLLSQPVVAGSRLSFVPAMRGTERPSYDLAEGPSDELAGPGGSLEQAQRLASTLAYRRELEEMISRWLERIVKRKVRTRLMPSRRVSLEAIADATEFNIVNEGFGSNQLTYILTQLAILPRDWLVAIEEPEIHLHPAAQSALVDVLVEAAREGGKQLVLTTHSEHVLYSLMRLVAAGALTPDDISLHYMHQENAVCQCRRLAMDVHGRVEGGLPGFFDVQVEEFRRYVQAAQGR